MFLMIIDHESCEATKEVINCPEFTLWERFEDAMGVAFELAGEAGAKIDMTDAALDCELGTLYLPGVCEIMPITLSTPQRITWLGKERRSLHDRKL